LRSGDASIGMVEHLLAALAGADIDDCLIEVDGPEPPVLDGDALSYLVLIEKAGIAVNAGTRLIIELLKPVVVTSGPARARLLPAPHAEYAVEIEFVSAAIGRQSFAHALSHADFRREIAPARTFGFLADAEKLRAAGFGRGADLTNTLVLDGDALINPDLSRFPDEFVRHKLLDAIGDMKLSGHPLRARYEASRPSHTLNNQLLRALFADPENCQFAES
jgi:UDP-3-O-[3-hydroxymyristoyl] N-acetylglucosamine deacetylase